MTSIFDKLNFNRESPPNPSIERTSSRWLRQPEAAAHVKRSAHRRHHMATAGRSV
jgi:hypothetical protein